MLFNLFKFKSSCSNKATDMVNIKRTFLTLIIAAHGLSLKYRIALIRSYDTVALIDTELPQLVATNAALHCACIIPALFYIRFETS